MTGVRKEGQSQLNSAAVLDCNGSELTIELLEYAIRFLVSHGAVTIRNCAGASPLTLGAQLAAIAQKQ